MRRNLKLKLVQSIFRHGARTPTKAEAKFFNITDPSIYDPPKFHQLTNEGKSQAYRLGSIMRKEYDQFLGDHNPDNYYAYSSVSARTKMSLQLVLNSLYPISNNEKWHSKLKLRSLPFEHAKNECDKLVSSIACLSYLKAVEDDTVNCKRYNEAIANQSEIIDLLVKMMGLLYSDELIVS